MIFRNTLLVTLAMIGVGILPATVMSQASVTHRTTAGNGTILNVPTVRVNDVDLIPLGPDQMVFPFVPRGFKAGKLRCYLDGIVDRRKKDALGKAEEGKFYVRFAGVKLPLNHDTDGGLYVELSLDDTKILQKVAAFATIWDYKTGRDYTDVKIFGLGPTFAKDGSGSTSKDTFLLMTTYPWPNEASKERLYSWYQRLNEWVNQHHIPVLETPQSVINAVDADMGQLTTETSQHNELQRQLDLEIAKRKSAEEALARAQREPSKQNQEDVGGDVIDPRKHFDQDGDKKPEDRKPPVDVKPSKYRHFVTEMAMPNRRFEIIRKDENYFVIQNDKLGYVLEISLVAERNFAGRNSNELTTRVKPGDYVKVNYALRAKFTISWSDRYGRTGTVSYDCEGREIGKESVK